MAKPTQAETYNHRHADSPMRPEIGTQAQFRKKKPPQSYRYDSSLSPAMDWDGQNSAREQAEALIRKITDAETLEEAKAAAAQLKALGQPFLNWAGRAERLSFDVPTLPLFVHERLSTKAIIETLTGHKRDKQMDFMAGLFGDPQHSITDQMLRAYEHRDKWVNRMILGDSLVVMNSLLHYENLGGQVQMIYIDPPYGVKFGSNFQPFVRKRDVTHGNDEDMTREPETVQAYRDTWELGLHSYLTYIRDRLLLAYDLLAPTGSIFVQISDANLHHVREVMDEVFDAANFMTTIVFEKTGAEETKGLANTSDYLLWYCKDKERVKVFPLYREKRPGEPGAKSYKYVRSPDYSVVREMTAAEIANPSTIPSGWKICMRGYPLTSQDYSETRTVDFGFEGKTFHPGKNRHWSISPDKAIPALVAQGRIYSTKNSLRAIIDLDEIPGAELDNVWHDTGTGSFTDEQLYVVQTSEKVLQRCILMTTEPGDLILDPTCGGGTTAYVAERWGRRWITIDISRVPLALARQRLLVATFPYFKLKEEQQGPIGGFDYLPSTESRNRKVDGYGIAMQHTLSSIAGEESPKPIIFRENPEIDYSITRVTGPFCVEATIPAPSDWEADGEQENETEPIDSQNGYTDRMLDILRRSPILRLGGNQTISLKNVRPPAKTLSLSAEALVEGDDRPLALVFGPENGSVSEKLVFEAAREAYMKGYERLIVIGFSIEPTARTLAEQCADVVGVPAIYVQATPDLSMGDLLKNMRSSQIFSVCGLPDVAPHRVKTPQGEKYQAELRGVDVFDPVTMKVDHCHGEDVPAWFLDTDYNGLCFHVCQAFFPRTAAWDSLKKALKDSYEVSVWDHLAGATSAPFEAGTHGQIAVKVIDDRGNELMVVKNLSEGVH